MSDKNLTLNKNLLGGEREERNAWGEGVKALRARGRGSHFGNFCAYVLYG